MICLWINGFRKSCNEKKPATNVAGFQNSKKEEKQMEKKRQKLLHSIMLSALEEAHGLGYSTQADRVHATIVAVISDEKISLSFY